MNGDIYYGDGRFVRENRERGWKNTIERGVFEKVRFSVIAVELAYANYNLSIYVFYLFVKYIVKKIFLLYY